MERIKKYIKIEWITKNQEIILSIIDQTHRGSNFGTTIAINGTSSFTSKNDITLYSDCYPERGRIGSNLFYVRGNHMNKDYDHIRFPKKSLIYFINAINEYNSYNNSPEIQYEFAEATKIIGIIKISLPMELFEL